MKPFSILLLTFAMVQELHSQPTIEWQKSFGGSLYEAAYNVQSTSDGGYICAGSSPSSDGDLSTNHGGLDCWIVKLNNLGVIQWQTSFGGSGEDEAKAIIQTADGGYAFAGKSSSNDGDVSGNHGQNDAWLVKLSSTGSIEWQKSYGGSSSDAFSTIKPADNGGYIVGGNSYSNDGDLTLNNGASDLWVLKLNSTGDIDWQKNLGGSTNDYAKSIDLSLDGGYVVAGYTNSNDGDVLSTHGSDEIWILKLTSAGTTEWQKFIGGSGSDFAWNVRHCDDGGVVIAGSSSSNDGDLSANLGSEDCFILKLSAAGGIQWKKSFGGSMYDIANSIYQTNDGGFILAAATTSNDGDVDLNVGLSDFWLIKLDPLGIMEWQKSLGGSLGDIPFSIVHSMDGGFVVLGSSQSNDGDLSANHGMEDLWIVKLSAVQSVQTLENSDISIYPNPAKDVLILSNISKGNYLEIQDSHGQTIHSQFFTSDQVELLLNKNLSSGIYFVHVLEGEKLVGVRKIIIE